MTDDCKHETLHELCTATLRYTWELQEDGSYLPDVEAKNLGEDSEEWECVECGESVHPECDRLI